MYNEDYTRKLQILKELDPYDRSGIDKQSSGKATAEQERLVTVNERESKNEVKWDFEHIGVLFKKGSIPKEEFLSAYWRVIIICWKVLESDIKDKQRRQPSYMSLFEELFGKAEEYRERRDLKEIIFAYPTGSSDIAYMLEINNE
jgi:hypothetical protein